MSETAATTAPVLPDYAWRRVATCVPKGSGDKKWFDVTFEDGTKGYSRRPVDYMLGMAYPVAIQEHKKEGSTVITYEIIDIPMTPEVIATKPKPETAGEVAAQVSASGGTPGVEHLPPSMRPAAAPVVATESTNSSVTKGKVVSCSKDGAPWPGNDGKMQTYEVSFDNGALGKMYAPDGGEPPVKVGEEYTYHVEISPKKVKKIVLDMPTVDGGGIHKDVVYLRLQCLNAAVALLAIPGELGAVRSMKVEPTTATLIAKTFERHIMRNDEQPTTTPAQ